MDFNVEGLGSGPRYVLITNRNVSVALGTNKCQNQVSCVELSKPLCVELSENLFFFFFMRNVFFFHVLSRKKNK